MKRSTVKELLSEGVFKYDQKKSPADNYQLFQQAISLERGVEFLSSSNEHASPIIYLVKVPGLSIDTKATKAILEKFNKDLLNHLAFYIQHQKDNYKVFETFYDLCNAVLLQQEEYHLGKEKYFGVVTLREFAFKEIKKLKVPLIHTIYRGTFLNQMLAPASPAEFKELGSDMKKFLSSLYMMKRKSNMQLISKLEAYKKVLFNKNNLIGNYQYTGEIADVIEIALALNETGKLQSLNHRNLDVNKFCNDFCKFLSIPYSKLSNHLPTISKRNIVGKLFLTEAKKKLKASSKL